MNSLLKSFLEIEEFKKREFIWTEEEQICEAHFVKDTTFNANGRV